MSQPRVWSARPERKFAPHYEAAFTPEQLSRFEAAEYKHVDSRSIRAMMVKVGVEVRLTGPANQDLCILVTKDGYYERCKPGVSSEIEVEWGDQQHSHQIGYVRCPLGISSISIPTGISKLAFVFKMQKDNNAPDGPERMFAF